MVKICVFDTETTGLPPILDGKDWNERNANDTKLMDYTRIYLNHPLYGDKFYRHGQVSFN